MEQNHSEHSNAGVYGWLCISTFIMGFDAFAPETLTSAFKRGTENPKSRYLVLGAWAVTTAHLLQLIPHDPVELDPFNRVAHLFNREP